jgi:DNA repair protein RecO (recombination protein O)
VLGTTALGDADLIVTLLAEHSGRVRGVARSGRKSRARFGVSLEPLSRVRATWTERTGADLHRLESLELLRTFAPMQAEPAVQAACALMAEVGAWAVREDQEEPATFRLYGAVLEAMEGGLPPWCAVRYFEYWRLRLHGVLAEGDACTTCGRPLAASGGVSAVPAQGPVCRTCAVSRSEAVRLSSGEREALRRFAASPPSDVADLRDDCGPGSALARYLRASLESFLERRPRAYRHMEALP